MNPNFDGIHSPNGMDLHSPNDMLLDSDEFVTEIPEDDKDDVAIIDPDQLSNGAEALPKRPRADDYEAMKAEVLPPLQEQPRILADAVNTWNIEDWHRLPKKHHGPVFEAGGYPWRILMFPYGNNVEFCSFYLEQGFPDSKPPDDYTCCAQFALVMWNPNDPTIWTTHHAHHRFTKEEGDWGFTRYLEMRKLFNVTWPGSNRPMVENDCVNMTAYVRVVEDETGVLWHGFTNYDSKKATGFVGLKNQGATCYLNSLIQTLYFTNAFRKAVYQIPTQDEQDLANSAYTLQRLFYQLQMSSTAVGTNELTKSFGWDARAIFEQQDVQELSRKLMERMEEKMKGTEAENALSKLFCGKVRTYISCINVTYESRRVEDFWDLQLNVAGNKNLEDSFKEYIEVETMDGENRYYAGEEFKLQDANKGVIFESLPEVLHLQLKRFQFDFDSESMKKVNDRFEFPETFDAAPFLADDADKSESWVYQLHGVLVHSGDLNAGHYYAFIKPNKDGWFYKYDDDRVTKATLREVLEENFGGEYLPPNGQIAPQRTTPILRQNSAYMLVYIRQSRVDNVLQPVTKEDTPEHLQKKLDEEAAIREARRKEREEAPLYLNVRVITEDTFKLYGGTDLTAFEHQHETDPAAARSYRLLRKSTVADLAVTVAKDIGQDPKRLRFWCMVNRQNKTIRPDSPIGNPNITIEEAYQQLSGSKEPHLRLWAESSEEVGPDGEAIWPSHQPDQNGTLPKTDLIVLFLKEFDMENQVLRGVGHIYISRDKKVEDLVPAINKKMGWEKVRLKLWEEIKPQMVDPMKAKATLKAAELQDGDIICFQRDNTDTRSSIETKSSITESDQSMSISHITNLVARADFGSVPKISVVDRFDDAMKYYEFLIYKRVVHFAPHPTRGLVPDGGWERFSLTLSTKWSYDQVTIKLGEKLGVDSTHIRLWTWNSTTNNPKSTVKRQQQQTLASMLNPGYSTFSNNNQRADSFFFEVLDMSLSELDTKKSLKVTWLSEGVSKEEILDILVPKNGVVEDIITGILKKTQIDDEIKGGPIRVYEVHSSKINRELAREASVTNVTEYTTLVAERVPEEEIAEPQHSIQVYHFHGEPNKAYGTPFKFLLKELETFAETKKRLEKRTGIKGKNFEKIKFAVVKRSAYSKPIYLGDDDVLWDLAPNEDDMLGLDHVDRTRSRGNGAGDLTLK